jgi:hypothetical protein
VSSAAFEGSSVPAIEILDHIISGIADIAHRVVDGTQARIERDGTGWIFQTLRETEAIAVVGILVSVQPPISGDLVQSLTVWKAAWAAALPCCAQVLIQASLVH